MKAKHKEEIKIGVKAKSAVELVSKKRSSERNGLGEDADFGD